MIRDLEPRSRQEERRARRRRTAPAPAAKPSISGPLTFVYDDESDPNRDTNLRAIERDIGAFLDAQFRERWTATQRLEQVRLILSRYRYLKARIGETMIYRSSP